MRLVHAVLALLIMWLPASAVRAEVSLRNGNFFKSYTDAAVPGGLDMHVERIFNSKAIGKSIFGAGWGFNYASYLQVLSDGRIVIHEWGTGAENVFSPVANSAPRTETTASMQDRLTRSAMRTGAFGSNEDIAAFRETMLNESKENDQSDQLAAIGLLDAAPAPPEGSVFYSGKFSAQTVTRVREGYERQNGTQFEAYDLRGRLQRIWDRNHNFVALHYDDRGKLVETVDSQGDVFTFAYNANGYVSSLTDQLGRKAVLEYSGDDLVQSTDVEKNTYGYKYDSVHNMTEIDYPDKSSDKIEYYGARDYYNVKSYTDHDGTVTDYAYRSDPGREGSGERSETVTLDLHNGNGKPISHSSYQYFLKRVNGLELQVRLITTIDNDVTDTTYNSDGLPLEISHNGATTKFAYDSLGHVVHKYAADGTVTDLTYEPRANKVASVVVHRGSQARRSDFTYDDKGNLLTATTSDGKSLRLTYDDSGHIATMVNKQGQTLNLTYNRASKPINIELVGVGALHITYTETGEIEKVDSDKGRAIALQVTGLFQELLEILRPAGVTLSF